MTNITSTARTKSYTGNGTAGPFDFSFQVNAFSEVKVFVDTTLKTAGVHYNVENSSSESSKINTDGTGRVRFTSSNFPTSSQKITIVSNVPLARTSVYTTSGPLTASALETDFDTSLMHHQQISTKIDRTVGAPESDPDTISMTLPSASDRANRFMKFDTNGNVTTTLTPSDLGIGASIIFEGSTANDYETTLTVTDPTADRTWTIPDVTDTFVGLSATQTLTNKTLTTPVITEIDSGSTITLDATTDIILDADGGDIFFKDAGTTFGSATNTSGNLIIKSGTTTALTFSGANVTSGGNFTVTGDLTVNGDTVTVNTATLSVEDPLIILAKSNNSSDSVDIGFYGLYDTSGSQDLYAGLFRDAGDGKWKLFKDLQVAPTTTVNTSGTGYAVGTLVANLEGNVTGDVTGNVSGTAGIATSITASANNSTDETVFPTFVDGATGTQGLETDTGLTYNPSTGVLTATQFTGTLAGNATSATTATNANHISVADNENTDENNLIPFIEDASATGNVGLESDGDFHYNPSTGRLSATQLAGTLQTASQPNITAVGALDTGSITSGFGAIDNGTSGIRTSTFTAETSVLPDAVGGASLGSTSAEWGDIYIADDKKIYFGSGQDVSIEYDEDGTDTLLIQGGAVNFGVDDTGIDVKFFGATSGKYMEWDESADQLDVTGSLDVTGNTSMVGTLTVGVDDTGHDVKFFGATSGKYMEWDESADQLNVSGSFDVTGNSTMAGTLIVNNTLLAQSIKIFNAGTIGSISDPDAITIASDGKTTFSQNIIASGNIELGNASDTTLARSSAGVVTIEGNTIATREQLRGDATNGAGVFSDEIIKRKIHIGATISKALASDSSVGITAGRPHGGFYSNFTVSQDQVYFLPIFIPGEGAGDTTNIASFRCTTGFSGTINNNTIKMGLYTINKFGFPSQLVSKSSASAGTSTNTAINATPDVTEIIPGRYVMALGCAGGSVLLRSCFNSTGAGGSFYTDGFSDQLSGTNSRAFRRSNTLSSNELPTDLSSTIDYSDNNNAPFMDVVLGENYAGE